MHASETGVPERPDGEAVHLVRESEPYATFFLHHFVFAEKEKTIISVDHTAWQMLDPIRTPKLRNARPCEYLAGGPPGKAEESTFSKRFVC